MENAADLHAQEDAGNTVSPHGEIFKRSEVVSSHRKYITACKIIIQRRFLSWGGIQPSQEHSTRTQHEDHTVVKVFLVQGKPCRQFNSGLCLIRQAQSSQCVCWMHWSLHLTILKPLCQNRWLEQDPSLCSFLPYLISQQCSWFSTMCMLQSRLQVKCAPSPVTSDLGNFLNLYAQPQDSVHFWLFRHTEWDWGISNSMERTHSKTMTSAPLNSTTKCDW